MNIRRIIKKYYEQLYDHKFDNLHKVNQFLERQNLPKLTQEKIDNLNWFKSIKGTESITYNFTKQKIQSPNRFTAEFYQIFKKKIIPILHNLSENRSRTTSRIIFRDYYNLNSKTRK